MTCLLCSAKESRPDLCLMGWFINVSFQQHISFACIQPSQSPNMTIHEKHGGADIRLVLSRSPSLISESPTPAGACDVRPPPPPPLCSFSTLQCFQKWPSRCSRSHLHSFVMLLLLKIQNCSTQPLLLGFFLFFLLFFSALPRFQAELACSTTNVYRLNF